MISCKRDVLERQSLSEVKMGRGSPICERVHKKIVEYFKNNVPQHQIAKALQISSSTDHNIIKRFRETEEISVCKGQGQRPLLDARGLWVPDNNASLIGMFLSLTLLNGPRNTSRTVGKHNPTCHLQVPTKALSCKKEAICEHGPEASKFDILVGHHGRRVLRAKEKGDLPVCYQRSVQKPASLMVWGCISA